MVTISLIAARLFYQYVTSSSNVERYLDEVIAVTLT